MTSQPACWPLPTGGPQPGPLPLGRRLPPSLPADFLEGAILARGLFSVCPFELSQWALGSMHVRDAWRRRHWPAPPPRLEAPRATPAADGGDGVAAAGDPGTYAAHARCDGTAHTGGPALSPREPGRAGKEGRVAGDCSQAGLVCVTNNRNVKLSKNFKKPCDACIRDY